MTEEPPDALFDLAAAGPTPAGGTGRAERLTTEAIAAAAEASLLVDEDKALIGVALIGARALDVAERMGAKGVWAIANLQNAQRETLLALRMPAAVVPAEQPRAPAPAGAAPDLSSLLSDHFGTPG